MSELKAYNVVATADVNPEMVDILGCTEWPAYDKSEADKVIARYKYKHCLDMAYKCVVLCQKSKDLYRWAEDENLEHYYNHKIDFFARWHNRWMELAEKFKEAK